MKSFIQIIFIATLVSLYCASCKKGNFLDPVQTGELNNENVFTDSVRTMLYLANVYSALTTGVPPQAYATPGAQNGSLSDEAEVKWLSGSPINEITIESFGQRYATVANGLWRNLYIKIRAANIFLRDVDKGPLSAATKERTKAEVRFIRAYCYSILMSYYGGVPLMGDEVKTEESSGTDVVRSSFSDCVNYLVSELSEIAPKLPLSYSGVDYGRVTRGAALALKGKILLYAASPFFNGGATTDDPRQNGIIAYPTANASRWQKAFDAIKDLIDMPGNPYSLVIGTKPGEGYYKVFLQRVNPEFILAVTQAPNRNMETFLLPPSRDNSTAGGYAGTTRGLEFPTQELIDTYPMLNGKSIDQQGSGYNLNAPYKGRDPRFYYSIIFNEANYVSNTTQKPAAVLTYVGAGIDGIRSDGAATKTGYYFRKMCDTTVTINVGTPVDRAFPLIRYADVLLMYAEAANEVGQTALAMTQIKNIRQRAGIDPGLDGNYGLPGSPDIDEARAIIRNERMIELTCENSRFFDVRRWKLGEKLLNKPMTGMQITRTGNTYTYQRVTMPTRIFTFRSYLWPIPQSDINNNPDLIRNPGW